MVAGNVTARVEYTSDGEHGGAVQNRIYDIGESALERLFCGEGRFPASSR